MARKTFKTNAGVTFGLCLLLLGVGTSAEELKHSLFFSTNQLILSPEGEFTRVEMTGCELTEVVGEPQLPERIVRLVLPPGAKITDVSAVSSEAVEVVNDILVYPTQPPRPYSAVPPAGESIPFTEPKPEVYGSMNPYPASMVRFLGQGEFYGVTIAEIAIRPLTYMPLDKCLLLHESMDVSIEYTLDASLTKHRLVSLKADDAPRVKALVDNDTDVDGLLEATHTLTRASSDDSVTHEYVIVTTEALAPYFQPLGDWKKQKGLGAIIVTLEDIYQNYSGEDNAEKIREFLKTARDLWNVRWVLLGGDTNYVPRRAAYAMDCLLGSGANAIPCDLYFADLDGSWNDNGVYPYGETDDGVDLYTDVYVGRAPASTPTQAQVFVDKILTYETDPPRDYQTRALFAADVLWGSPYTNSGIGKNLIDDMYVPDHFEITKLYHDLGNESQATVVEAINRGQNLINHDGHASTNYMGVGDGGLRNNDMDGLNNGPRFSVLYSIGCYPANFEGDCIAEHFVNNPNGGGVAFIGNSRYGWGSPGNPKYGYSDRFDQQFYKFLFQENVTNIGQTLAMAKAYYAPYSRQENVYRWCQYEVTLLGDPEMPIWTDEPGDLIVELPERVPAAPQHFMVSVLGDGGPVGGARVCVMQGSDVYESGFTDAAGQYATTISPVSPVDSVVVTVTAQNYIPSVTKVGVVSSEAYVAYKSHSLSENVGNQDGVVNPGEQLFLDLTLQNYGGAGASGVSAVLRSLDPTAEVLDSTATYGDIPVGATVGSLQHQFEFLVSQACNDRTLLRFQVSVAGQSGSPWKSVFSVPVATPVLSLLEAQLSDLSYGDGDRIAEPGERIEVSAVFENNGSALARNASVQLSTRDSEVDIVTGQVALGDLLPDASAEAVFLVDIPVGASTVYFPTLDVILAADEGYAFTDSMTLVVGATGFADDIEGGEGAWVHEGTNDLWNISVRRSHSGDRSWYCGDKTAGSCYASNMDATLTSPEFPLAPHSELTFWAWYDVAVYSEGGYRGDGLYVEVWDGASWLDLDFIGTGGALDSTLMGNAWLPYTYDLSSLDQPTSKIRFRFISDPEEEFEGVYVDDVVVRTSLISDVEEPLELAVQMPAQFDLRPNYPNPFNPATEIAFSVPASSRIKIAVFNVLGQLVAVIVDEEFAPGTYHAQWDGTDGFGIQVPSGVYFYRMSADAGAAITKKMMLMR